MDQVHLEAKKNRGLTPFQRTQRTGDVRRWCDDQEIHDGTIHVKHIGGLTAQNRQEER